MIKMRAKIMLLVKPVLDLFFMV